MKTQEQFLADSNKCPNCNSGDTQYGQIEVMMDGAVQLVTCGQCGAGWEEM
jgi:transcription elongation factor Elf1